MNALYSHETVLKQEAVDALRVEGSGVYVDGTFGRGGHSRLILEQLGDSGRLYVIDCDPEAIAEAQQLAAEDDRVTVCAGTFGELQELLSDQGVTAVDGLLFDFGVSSPQIDQAERGFSFQRSGPLDMRMDNSQGLSAAEWLASAEPQEMRQVFWRYGEEKNANRIARKIAEVRMEKPLQTTAELAQLVAEINFRDHKNPATRVFQAIRIHINKELEQIEQVLPQACDLLLPGGRLVVISFHSLEDRIVKRFMKKRSKTAPVDRRMPVEINQEQPELRLVGKPLKAVDVDANVRARSAIMRVAEKRHVD
ncbi:16S rRNA (cytosine(1402)-N(4))-methyltransferase RsmH [Marinicella sp. W31]|uniref:16S rRNA (cytosine(1402)-N(4))-methyltransferase RsmH n=1 Tax=Marinicella sp. W31 TaxID=3023713 RepID=UPI0037581F50